MFLNNVLNISFANPCLTLCSTYGFCKTQSFPPWKLELLRNWICLTILEELREEEHGKISCSFPEFLCLWEQITAKSPFWQNPCVEAVCLALWSRFFEKVLEHFWHIGLDLQKQVWNVWNGDNEQSGVGWHCGEETIVCEELLVLVCFTRTHSWFPVPLVKMVKLAPTPAVTSPDSHRHNLQRRRKIRFTKHSMIILCGELWMPAKYGNKFPFQRRG